MTPEFSPVVPTFTIESCPLITCSFKVWLLVTTVVVWFDEVIEKTCLSVSNK